MPELQSEFLDWLLSDPITRMPKSQGGWADAHQLDRRTLTRWKADKKFVREWEERAEKLNISVDRVQSVIESLHKQAVNGDVKAASLYLQYIDKFTPKKKVITESSDTTGLTDEEIAAEMRQLADEMADS